jgi:DNA-binding protein H-NS
VKKNSGTKVTNKSIKKIIKTIENLSVWSADTSQRNKNKISNDSLYNIIQFYKNFIENFVNIFPNIILNNVNYDDIHIPNYFKFSRTHCNKLKKYISEYYEKLKKFYGTTTLTAILGKIQQTSKNLVMISNITPSFTSIQEGDDTIKPVFDERTSRFLFEYYLLRVFINYIELSDQDAMIVTEITKEVELSDIYTVEHLEEIDTRVDLSMTTKQTFETSLVSGNKKELRQNIAELFICYTNILSDEKDIIDISYEEIQDKVFKLKEREKDLVTDRLKRMTDEERNADTILKINKLGMYSKGMQKGLTTLDKDFYDEEREFRDEMTKAERNIRQKNIDVNDENMDMLLDDYMEQQNIDREIEDEAYDMSYMNESYYDGNTDGVGAPEEEYVDYENEY